MSSPPPFPYRWLVALWVTAASGCTTGAPLGASTRLRQAGYRPFVRPSPSRAVPTHTMTTPPVQLPSDARVRVVEAAQSLVGKTEVFLSGKRWPEDCTGLVKALYASVGLDFSRTAESGDNGVTSLYRFAQRAGRILRHEPPQPGDLVFFRETYDQNRDGRSNDGLTHVGIVERIREDGTVLIIHRVQRGIVRYHMNLAHSTLRRAPGTGLVYNDTLRPSGGGRTERLTAELFEAYGSLLPDAPVSETERRLAAPDGQARAVRSHAGD